MAAAQVPVYHGPFGRKEAERLLWRAGFGPKPGEAKEVARKGLKRAVDDLLHPPSARLVGKAPTADGGEPLSPRDAWGHDHLWWLDRMVRSNQQLVERMTLIWHDWFATSNAGVGSQKWMLTQNGLFRKRALGNFESLLIAVTHDPAMLIWLNGRDNTKWSPNENYARELMEIFTLGAGSGYTEDDVREQARALTGWRNDWQDGVGDVNFRYDSTRHDNGVKVVFGKSGNFGWEDACRLCVQHPPHLTYFVRRLWSYFVPTPPPATTESALKALYKRSGLRDRAGRRRHTPAPSPLHRARDAEATGRPGRRHAQSARTSGRHGRLGMDLRDRRPAALLPARTSPVGARSGGSTRPPSAGAGSRPTTPPGSTRSTRAPRAGSFRWTRRSSSRGRWTSGGILD